jgi:hypothetical protein
MITDEKKKSVIIRVNPWRGFVLAAALGWLGTTAGAQVIEKPPAPAATNRVKAAPVPPVRVRAGSKATVEVPFEVAPGYHINSSHPKDALLVPTRARFDPPTDLAVSKVRYPAGEELTFAFAPDQKLSVYTGDFTVSALVSAARACPPGRYRVRGTLKYQACDDKACYPAGQAPFAFDVQVGRAARTTPRRRNPPQSPHVHQ